MGFQNIIMKYLRTLKHSFPLVIFLLTTQVFHAQKAQGSIALQWLDKTPPKMATGVSWGVPFKQGQLKSVAGFGLYNSDDQERPLQSWKMAQWPDGSIKWVGLATVVEPGDDLTLQLHRPPSKNKPSPIARQTTENILIDTGELACEIPKKGNAILTHLKINDIAVARKGQLICISQDGPETPYGVQPEKQRYLGKIESAVIEQNGPVRVVVKIQGKHYSKSLERAWLPFVVRLYFYKNQPTVKLVHSIIYDGDHQRDFIRGLGISFDVPLDEEIYNRHVRFSGENGLWDEPVQPLVGRGPFSTDDKNTYQDQLNAMRIDPPKQLTDRQQFFVKHLAKWNDYKLVQPTSEGFQIEKRTNDQSAYISAGAGKRATGMAFAGDVSGGLSVGFRNFWQSFPTSLEINNMRSETAQLKAWFWSPDAPPMDMRHYDTIPWGHHLSASYEDVQPGLSTPKGVARTSELYLLASEAVPTHDELFTFSHLANNPPLLTVSPQYIHQVPVFGKWSLPDRSTKGKKWIENQLDNAFEFYKEEVARQKWYGFWDYGDIMHSYDSRRHTWRYDVGGYAWANTELMPNLWLWYYYLRSARADVFRMAEAMTRHTGEVDVYHLGSLKGLGSRHNVRHWGCGSKEVRISQAFMARFYYYLTTDERVGDLMQEVVDGSNKAIGELDPLRLILEKGKYPTHARVGPDWFALVGNWMTAWERTSDKQYLQRIKVGINSFSKMPYGFFSAKTSAFGYDPSTYELFTLDENAIGSAHLSVLMGGPEVLFELAPLMDDKQLNKLLLEFTKLYGADKQTVAQTFGRRTKLGDVGPWYARMPAYYAYRTGDKTYAKKAWDFFLNERKHAIPTNFNKVKKEGLDILAPTYEIQGVSTNNTAQWCLNAIELLELVGDEIPDEHPRFNQ